MAKYTSKDIHRIANAMRRQAKDYPERPYALMIGAGCSKSAGIPLAGALVKEIKATYAAEIERVLGKDCDDDYGACMAVLSASEVRAVLKPYLDGSGINWGHLAIASLIDGGFVGRTLTFNFDSVLARACGLIGRYPATYDFVTGVSTRTNFISSPAILHLHGQGHGLALLNSKDETRAHADDLRPLLTDTFSRFPMIVAGYSGASDSVFEIIEEIFDGEQRLVWTDIHQDCPTHVRRLLDNRSGSSEYLGEADSDQFFMDLARELGCWPPKLFNDPHAHLLAEIAPIKPYPVGDGDVTDDNLLDALKAKLTTPMTEPVEQGSAKLSDILSEDWDAIIQSVPKETQNEHDRRWLSIAHASKADEISDRISEGLSEEEIAEMNEGYATALTLNPDFHQVQLNWGVSLDDLATATKNPELFRDAGKKYEAALAINPNDYKALSNWASTLMNLHSVTGEAHYLLEAEEKLLAAEKLAPDDT